MGPIQKIERLQSTLHCLTESEAPVNKHTIFVDTKEEAESFSPTEYFNTVPELVDRAYNRPTKEQLQKETLVEGDNQRVVVSKKRQYRELAERMKREEGLGKMIQDLEVKKQLMGKGKKRKIEKEDGTVVYKWSRERKR